jgi:L-fucose isomerase-like protein
MWEFDLIELPEGKLAERLAEARGSAEYMRHAERQAEELLAQPQVKLETGRRFVVNSFIAANLFKQLMREANATNLGVANCMGSLIAVLDTPPCLVLSLLNDEGYTAFCHTDYTQTPPGVLLRWVSSKPSFISNSHFPHHGLLTIAHCATPRRMDGRTYEPTRIMTHFESDYGAATRVEFRKGQALTNLIPNFACTAWYGFKGEIVDTPSLPMCRSQIDMKIAGDWQRLLRDMQGFHVVTCYGDYLREAGYAARKAGLRWENLSA